ncbi:Sjogren's syndrome/scleroderma autoantigen 1 family protein [Halobellus clavatus]|uniref:Sjogren's syndrome/scleroderma autoantigen 1 (Autoantigen p27) n=1 Tax=Halobellus clavatus TaxID=660517 RepID=A0A1H3E8T6_9EURY|nr:Sjogren's syndrome/scleroderma autoantigen 1 family protein [Halobellus clavatus]SDX74334.1 Sjogren's syndrome/scleroderma autoantigen 1 (Autoantigen p27) [Halobellus clavatus]
MSDFDEEAERRRLREKYEKDEERRKETQQMSELLLKGATMTNQHCGECGSPIFRYDGQEFCPSCQRVTGGEAAQQGAAGGSEADTGETADRAQQAANPTGSAGPSPKETAAESIDVGPVADERAGRPSAGRSGASSDGVDRGAGIHQRDTNSGSSDGERNPQRAANARSTDASRGVGSASAESETARTALLNALEQHADAAAAADDPRRAKDHLSAAREAAEALAALDR